LFFSFYGGKGDVCFPTATGNCLFFVAPLVMFCPLGDLSSTRFWFSVLPCFPTFVRFRAFFFARPAGGALSRPTPGRYLKERTCEWETVCVFAMGLMGEAGGNAGSMGCCFLCETETCAETRCVITVVIWARLGVQSISGERLAWGLGRG